MVASEAVPSGSVPSDGRLARGQRTRVKVAEALIELVEAGNPQPTAKEIADQAGISVRLVFHHFEDMDALYRSVIELQAARHWRQLHEIPADLPLAQRIDRTVRQRSRLFEAIGPIRRAITPQALRSDELSTMLTTSNRFLRDLLARTFDPELAASDPDRRELLDALDLAASWEAWDRLRRAQHLSAAAGRRTVSHLLGNLLGLDDGDRS